MHMMHKVSCPIVWILHVFLLEIAIGLSSIIEHGSAQRESDMVHNKNNLDRYLDVSNGAKLIHRGTNYL